MQPVLMTIQLITINSINKFSFINLLKIFKNQLITNKIMENKFYSERQQVWKYSTVDLFPEQHSSCSFGGEGGTWAILWVA